MQHLVNYNRSRDGNSYTGSSSSENVKDHHRSSSGVAANTGNGELRAHQTNMNSQHPSTSGAPTINGGIKTSGAVGPDQQNPPATQAVYKDKNEMRSTTPQYQQPRRPTSASHSPSNPPTNQSPRPAEISTNQSTKLNSQARVGPKPNLAWTQSLQQTASLPISTRSKPTKSKSDGINPQGNQGVASNKPSVMSSSTKLHDHQKPNNQQSNTLNSSLQSTTNRHDQDHVTPVINDSSRVQPTSSNYNQVPFTIDPSQVFNQDEFQRRRAVAVAAAEVTVARKASSAGSNGAVAEDPDESKKMELEMKQMIEKMRDYKAKDPSLFSHVWEQVKKGTPPIRASSQATVQQVLQSEPPADRSATSVVNDNNQLPSPSPTHNQLPLESELEIVNASSSKSKIDRGKFPAQRRRWGGSKASRKPAIDVKNSTDTPVLSKVHDLPNDASEPSTTYEAASGTMQKAMESYHENLDPRLISHQTYPQARTPAHVIASPEVIYVSGIGPTPAKNTASLRLANGEIGPRTPLSAQIANMTSLTSNNKLPAHTESSVAHMNNMDRPSEGTIWPEAHKWKLATTAAAALTSTPANAGKQLSAEVIHQILNKNPSYTTLCEILEARGFTIERGPFARTLLAAVPDFDSVKDQEQLGTPPLSSINPSHSSSAQKPPMSGMLIPPALANPSNPSNTLKAPSAEALPAVPFIPSNYQSIRWANHANVESTVQQSRTSHYDLHGLLQPLIPSPLPAPASAPFKQSTKEEMARKRSFNDIVDLTQASSDDDETQPPSKVPRIDHQRIENSTSSYIPSDKSPNIEGGMDSRASVAKGIDLSRYSYAPISATELKPLTVLGPLPPQSKRSHRPIANVIRVMNRNDALRRSTYNPKTICRDILVSSGKHPTMAPLNYHLDILRNNFDEVDNNSDLSTFRWDLVDPGGDPKPSTREIRSAAVEDVDMNDADDEDVEPATVAQPLNRRGHRRLNVTTVLDGEGVVTPEVNVNVDVVRGIKASISRRGRKPRRGRVSGTQAMPVNVDGSPNLNRNIGSEDQDLSRQGAGTGASTNYAHIGPNEVHEAVASGGAPSPRRGGPPAQKMFSTPVANTASMPGHSEAGSEPKRRGRPPGSKDKSIRKNVAILKSGDKPTRTHPRSSLLNTTPARPSTLRQTMTPTDGVAVVIESPSKVNTEKVRNVDLGRPRKRRKASPKSRQPSSPNHQVYKCQWKSCPAKLHNLETLRKHIRLHREGYPAGPFPCLWAGCGTGKVSSDDHKAQRQPLEFETETGWDRHMEGRHLDRYAWELGDGPSTQPSGITLFPTNTSSPFLSHSILIPIPLLDTDLSDYVSDSHGRQVTPIAVASGAPPDPLPVPYTRRDARVYHKAQGNRTEGEKTAAERRAQEVAIGEGSGGPVVLVTDDTDSEEAGEQEAQE